MVKMVLLTLINMLILLGAAHSAGLRLNVTGSYPLGFYQIQSIAWRRHDLVELCLPKSVATLAIQRAYAVSSNRCSGTAPVIKKVVAIEGDRVEINQRVIVNGQPIRNSELRTEDASGHTLHKAKGGVVAPDQVWVLSVFAINSFDSRYFGPIESRLIMHTLEPVWTF